jgi:hypothetical protein
MDLNDVKNLVINGDFEIPLMSQETKDIYEYRIRFPVGRISLRKKGLYYVTVKTNDKWCYVGHFWKSSLSLLRSRYSDFPKGADQIKTFEDFLSGLRNLKKEEETE